jgi:hypothetical protein
VIPVKEKYLIEVQPCGCIEVERSDKGPISGFAMACIAHVMLSAIAKGQPRKDPAIETVLIALKKAITGSAAPHSEHNPGELN